MTELRKEERLFIELGVRRGAISDTALAKARGEAKRSGVSVVEALVSQEGVTLDDAEAVRKALFELSFTCPQCDNVDFRELDEPKVKGRRCAECVAAGAATGSAAPSPVTVSDAKTAATAARRADPVGSQATEAGPDAGAAPPPSRPGGDELAVGVVLGGCRIERRIGQGGMGRVYKGHHDGLDRDMAVKVIDERLVAKKGFVEQFFAEARTLAKLDHQNVVRVFNVDTDISGRHFIVMELLEGGSVESYWREKGQKLALDDAVRITKEAAEGLRHAHEAGLIHRDVKPANLMLTKEGRVKVVDFGLAARTENDVFIATEVAGTPSYMAPEQVDGLRLDARCDQYALGASLFQLVCGRPPFEGRRAFEILAAHMNVPPPRPSELRAEIPAWVDALVAKMLAKAPEDRFASLAEVVAALEQKEAAAAPPPATSRPPIASAEITKLERGLKPRAVVPPSWRTAIAAIAGCGVAAALFLTISAREAFGGAELGPGEAPGFVRALERSARAQVTSGRAEDYALAIASVERAIADLGAHAGASRLAELRDALKADQKMLASATESALGKRIEVLVAAGRLGAALDLADPSSASLVALGLAKKAESWRASALDRLAKRGEVYVPAGPFARGEDGAKDALPGFYMDRTEVTNEAWAKLVAKAGLERPASWPAGPLPPALAKKPVTGVTFEQAKKFAKALGGRLPTSLEWEKAARGRKDARAWPWGPRFEPGRANVLDGGSGALEDVDAREGDESPYGAVGMAGNALEWVEGPEGPLTAGGGFRSHPLSARVFARFRLEARPDSKEDARDPAVGFRCVRDLEP